MKILFIQHDSFLNGSGGTEKICSFLANAFSKAGNKVIIAVNQEEGGNPRFYLEPAVEVQNIYDEKLKLIKVFLWNNYFGSNPMKWLLCKIIKKGKKLGNWIIQKYYGLSSEGIEFHNLGIRSTHWNQYIHNIQPDIIITMSISSLLEVTFKNEIEVPIIDSINGRPDYDYSDILGCRSLKQMNYLKDSFKYLAGCQVLFENYKAYLPDTFKGIARTIPNPLPQYAENNLVNLTIRKSRYKIVHLGALSITVKQQDIAIKVFSKVAEDYPEWDLEFWGTGHDEQIIQKFIKRNGLENRVFVKGFSNHPEEVLKSAEIFIFPSKYEGLPLALGEAMAIGLPCIGFKSCSGVNQLIKNNESGFLAEDEDEMVEYLKILMDSANLRVKMGRCGHEISKGYDRDEIIKKWKNLVEEVIDVE